MKGRADLSRLSGYTTNTNKNRTALFVVDRGKIDKAYRLSIKSWIEESLADLYLDQIDTIVIDVKERTW